MGKEPIEYPEIISHEYLIEWLLELGPTWETGMGRVALPHGEIRSWALNTCKDLVPLEVEWLRQLSLAYAMELQRAHNREVKAPYRAPPQESA